MSGGGDTCAMAPDVTMGGTFMGTTAAPAVDDYGPAAGQGCPAGGLGSGRDVAFAVSPTLTTNYSVTVTPQNGTYDPMVYVQLTCGDVMCLGGTILNGPGEAETVTFSVPGGLTVYIIVDGENASSGPFSMTVSQ